MSKLKILLLSLFFLLLGNKIHAQHLWYENETATKNITFTRTVDGTFTADETNPDDSGINTNATNSKFIRDANVNRGFIYFDLYTPLTTASKYTITLKAYTDVATSDLSSEPNRLRIYLQNTTTGDFKQITKTFTVGQTWENFSFVFDKSDFTTEGLANGGYNQMYIGFGNGQESTSAITYYIDQINGSIPQIPLEDVLKGSWGVRFYIRSGGTLDNYVDNLGYDYIAGAQEIIDSYPTIGHVITNATNNAKSHLWSLITNPNVDVVMGATNSIVDEEFVPSLEKEHIIIDVINMFKNANKKVILYLNSNDPANRATIAGAAAWNNYVDTYFAGDGHKAWMNYCEGYIKRYTELGVDGYWIDAFSSYHFGDVSLTQTEERQQKDEFIQMIRNAAPNAILGVNEDKDYFTDEGGEFLRVKTDGINDPDKTTYRIIKLSATDSYSDFTAGHITPLGQGAPPNSWGYEEFTVPDVEESSSSIFEGNRALKHLFLPMRETWSNEDTPLVYTDEDQAYRFAKRITDAGGAVTFSSTTSDDGTPSADEAEILKFVNQQFAINADATVYERPEGAFLVGEDQSLSLESSSIDDFSLKVFPNPVKDVFKLSKEVNSVTIYTLTGAKILEFSGNEDNFDVSHLNSGFYIVKASNKNNTLEVIKFFKK